MRNLNDSRAFDASDPEDDGRAIYAGSKGRRIGRCWPLPPVEYVRPEDYDRKVFKAWITGRRGVSAPVTGVRNVELRFTSSAKRSGEHTAAELYVMDEGFFLDGRSGIPQHSVDDEILCHARLVLGSVVASALGRTALSVVPAPLGCDVRHPTDVIRSA